MSYSFFEDDSDIINQPPIDCQKIISTREDEEHELSIFFASPDADEENNFDQSDRNYIDVQSSQFELDQMLDHENFDIFDELIQEKQLHPEPHLSQTENEGQRKKKPKKNSNLIKKMGRMIMENLRSFKKRSQNKGLEKMLAALKERAE